MNYKIVFSDIDGTFLTSEHKVTPHTAGAVRELLGKGIPFALVSARMPEAIYPITRHIGVTIPIISYSGALVLTEKEEVLYSKTMDKEAAASVLRRLQQDFPEVTVNYYAGRKWYVRDTGDRLVQQEMDITSAVAEEADFASLLAQDILPHKILTMSEPEACARMEKELGEAFPHLHVVRSSAVLLEIMDESVSKATGIEVLLAHYGFKPEEAVAFGDNYNDLEMLRYVGCSVAMANAPEDIKKEAKEVTLANNEEGIYIFLVKEGLASRE